MSPHGTEGASVLVEAWAKLTTSLRVTGVREDGYHLIDAEMVTLDLADQLRITPGGQGVRFVGPYAPEIAPGTDLVSKALALTDRSASVEVTKNIPAGGGLGGGSADAAAVLRWADIDDPLVGVRLGADVPFCMLGGQARVEGIGEVLTPLPYTERTFTLFLLPFGCSTPAVYQAWDELGGPTDPSGNDLFPAAEVVEPRLVQWRQQISEVTGQPARLAGSGSTMFVEGAFPGDGRVVVSTRR